MGGWRTLDILCHTPHAPLQQRYVGTAARGPAMIPKGTEKPSENKSDLSLSLYMSVTCHECKGENRHWCSTLGFQLGFGLSLSLSTSLKLCSIEEKKALIIQILIKHSIGLGFFPPSKIFCLCLQFLINQTSHTLPKILKYMKRPEKSFLNPVDN